LWKGLAVSPKTISGKGKRYPLNMRTTKELRERLERAANKSGRSLVQEVEHRLEMSFAEEDYSERLRKAFRGISGRYAKLAESAFDDSDQEATASFVTANATMSSDPWAQVESAWREFKKRALREVKESALHEVDQLKERIANLEQKK
jgi:TraY domain